VKRACHDTRMVNRTSLVTGTVLAAPMLPGFHRLRGSCT
jgi:hypothetical protein